MRPSPTDQRHDAEPSYPAPEAAHTHLKDYVWRVFARWHALATCVLLCLLAATVYLVVQKPMYRAEAILLIEPPTARKGDFRGSRDLAPNTYSTDLARREFSETQQEILLSKPLLTRVFRQLGFHNEDEFREKREPVDGFRDYFRVEPTGESQLVSVSFDWKEPMRSAQVVEALVREYIDDSRRRAVGVNVAGVEALRAKAEELRPEVEDRAHELQEFMVEKNMVSLEKQQNIVVERLKEINRLLAEVEVQRLRAASKHESIKNAVRKGEPLGDLPEIADSNTIQDLKLEQIRAQQELVELDGRFGPNHPEVVKTKARLKAVEDKIAFEVDSVLAAALSQYKRGERQSEGLQKELRAQERRVMAFNKLSIQYDMLRSAHLAVKNTFLAVQKRIEEIEIAMAAGSKDDYIFVVTRPEPPTKPAYPKMLLTIVLASGIGSAAGLGMCFFVDYLDTTVKTKQEVEHVVGAPAIGYVPALGKGRDGTGKRAPKDARPLVMHDQTSIGAEAFRSLRTSLLFASAAASSRRYLITSPAPQEGKTMVSANLAVAFAQAGNRVLLIDADMRKPALHLPFGMPSEPGLSNYLAQAEWDRIVESRALPDCGGGTPFPAGEVLWPIESVPGLWLLSSGPIPPSPVELLDSDRMTSLLVAARDEFDVVIVDAPPSVGMADAAVLSRSVDGTVLVVRTFATQRGMLSRAREAFHRAHGKIVGVVLNNVDMPRTGYQHGDYLYYYRSKYYSKSESGESKYYNENEDDD